MVGRRSEPRGLEVGIVDQGDREGVHLETLLELASEAVFVMGWRGRVVTYWSPAAQELYGWSPAEARGKDARQLLGSQYSEPWKRIEEALLTKGRWEGHAKRRTEWGG